MDIEDRTEESVDLREIRQTSFTDLLDESYLESGNKARIDYWAPLSRIIVESMEIRRKQGITQQSLAEMMKTRQSVISRFENMGRIPNYDFVARLAIALGHAPGMTLYGDYMATVPLSKQEAVRVKAAENGVSTRTYVESLMERALFEDQRQIIDTSAYTYAQCPEGCFTGTIAGQFPYSGFFAQDITPYIPPAAPREPPQPAAKDQLPQQNQALAA